MQKTMTPIPWREIITDEVHSEEAPDSLTMVTWDLSLCDGCTLPDCYQKNKDCKEKQAGGVFENGNFKKRY